MVNDTRDLSEELSKSFLDLFLAVAFEKPLHELVQALAIDRMFVVLRNSCGHRSWHKGIRWRKPGQSLRGSAQSFELRERTLRKRT